MTIRTRTRGGFSAVDQYQYNIDTTCSHTSWTQIGSIPVRTGKYEVMTDTVVKGFRKRQAAGEVFFNDMIYDRIDAQGSGSGIFYTSVANSCASPAKKSKQRNDGNWSYGYLPKKLYYTAELPEIVTLIDPGTLRDLESQVSTEMLSQRGRGDSNLYESIAEIDKTFGLFDRPISRLSQTFNKAAQAKREGKFAGYTVDGISHLWLAYRYGIMPAVNDIQGIIEGLTKKTEKRRETIRAKKGMELSKTFTVPTSWAGISMNVINDVTDSVTVRAMSLDEFSTSLWENIGFTPKGLITVPWELVRYSFVIDWFVNVGDFLGAIIPAFGWNNIGSCLVTIRGTTNRYRVTGGTNLISSTYTISQYPTGVYDISRLTRTRSKVRFPDLVIKNDFRFDKPKRVADALALLAQRGKYLFS